MTRKTMKDCRIVNGFTESGRFLSIRQSRPFTKMTTKASAPTASQISGEVLLLEREILVLIRKTASTAVTTLKNRNTLELIFFNFMIKHLSYE